MIFLGLVNLLSKLREYIDPKIVLEATSVYSRRLDHFFDSTGYRYTKLNLLAAKSSWIVYDRIRVIKMMRAIYQKLSLRFIRR